jgi:hypothetical protein
LLVVWEKTKLKKAVIIINLFEMSKGDVKVEKTAMKRELQRRFNKNTKKCNFMREPN